MSLVARYCLVLEELRLEALGYIEGQLSPIATGLDDASGMDRMGMMATEYANILGAPVPYLEDTNTQSGYGSAPADLATWMQFRSLVSEKAPRNYLGCTSIYIPHLGCSQLYVRRSFDKSTVEGLY